ncbi:MAG TPA: hypothetical protein VD926_15655 [Acidimicrobiales bacterium]|nr:hypothetical protein [Acidimicrobiales bacterium]
MTECAHAEARWELATDEDGWACDCGKLGFRPDLDAELIEEKVGAVLFWLAHHDVVSVSNGTTGDYIVANVAQAARKAGRYDQYTIVSLILSDPNLAGHAEYWAKRSAEWLDAEREGRGHEKPVDQVLRESGMRSLFEGVF